MADKGTKDVAERIREAVERNYSYRNDPERDARGVIKKAPDPTDISPFEHLVNYALNDPGPQGKVAEFVAKYITPALPMAMMGVTGVPGSGGAGGPSSAMLHRPPQYVKEYRGARSMFNKVMPTGAQTEASNIERWNAGDQQLRSDMELGNVGSLGFEKAFADILRGNWFHGTDPRNAQMIIRGGPDLSYTGREMGVRLGEPHGFSITNSPASAGGFGDSILRIMPLLAREEVLIPSFGGYPKEVLKNAYTNAMQKTRVDVPKKSEGFGNSIYIPSQAESQTLDAGWGIRRAMDNLLTRYGGNKNVELKSMMKDWFKDINEYWYNAPYSYNSPRKVALETFMANMKPEMLSAFNKELSKQIMDQGFNAVFYNPARMNEFEMRILNPRSIAPLDIREPLSTNAIPRRYITNKIEQADKVRRMHDFTRAGATTHLGETYKEIPLDVLFGQ